MMIAFLMLSTSFAQAQHAKRTKTLVTCGPSGFWSKVKSMAAFELNDFKNKLMADKGMDNAFSEYNQAVQDFMGLQLLENRVSCLDTNQETKPCTELYTKATCQEVAKFIQSDGGQTTCQPLGEVEGKTQLECQSPEKLRPVCNGTFYLKKVIGFFGEVYHFPRCLEGWAIADGHSEWKSISNVDCNDPSCVEISSKEDRLEAARKKLLGEVKSLTEGFKGQFAIATGQITDEQMELLKSLQEVLEGNKSKGMFLLEVVGDLLSNKWDRVKEWFVELF